jgi:hypothetical protein
MMEVIFNGYGCGINEGSVKYPLEYKYTPAMNPIIISNMKKHPSPFLAI